MHEDHLFYFDCLLRADRIALCSGCGYNYLREKNVITLCRLIHGVEAMFEAAECFLNKEKAIFEKLIGLSKEYKNHIMKNYGLNQYLVGIVNQALLERPCRKQRIRNIRIAKEVLFHSMRGIYKANRLCTKTAVLALRLLPASLVDFLLILGSRMKRSLLQNQ